VAQLRANDSKDYFSFEKDGAIPGAHEPLRLILDRSSQMSSSTSTFLWSFIIDFIGVESFLALGLVNKEWNWHIKNLDESFWVTSYVRKGWRKHKLSDSYLFDLVERMFSLRTVEQAWERLCLYAPAGFLWTLNSGANEEKIASFEDRMGLVLPMQLRASYQLHDGQNPAHYVEGYQMPRILSLAEVEQHFSSRTYIYSRKSDLGLTLIPVAEGIAVAEETGSVYKLLGYAGEPFLLHHTWARYLAIS